MYYPSVSGWWRQRVRRSKKKRKNGVASITHALHAVDLKQAILANLCTLAEKGDRVKEPCNLLP